MLAILLARKSKRQRLGTEIRLLSQIDLVMTYQLPICMVPVIAFSGVFWARIWVMPEIARFWQSLIVPSTFIRDRVCFHLCSEEKFHYDETSTVQIVGWFGQIVKQQRAYEIACLESFFCLSFSDREKYARCLLVIMCIVCVYGHLIFDNGLLQP